MMLRISAGGWQGIARSETSIAAFSPHGARMATCPECEYDELDTDDFEEGDELSCPECGKRLVMTGDDEVDLADGDDDEDEEEDVDD